VPRWLAVVVRPLLLLLGSLPILPELLSRVPGLATLGNAIEIWFSFQCHRDVSRSLSIWGKPFPVCARCLGIYWGLALGALLLRPRLTPKLLKLCVGSAMLVMLLDVLTEALQMRPESAPLRLVTGLLLSWPISAQLGLLAQQSAASNVSHKP